ncbi:lonely Cys domain-containing protein [Streptomyces griseoaurantiacus]|uniref:lonely Cys domain-containing protein n=1 Tax=Streptomyces griseoaurantiacus TaxID=68213 RepID=UPI0036363C8B
MAIIVSPKLNWLFFVLIGETFLQADEDTAYGTSRSYRAIKRDVGRLREQAQAAMAAVSQGFPPGVARQFVAAIGEVLPYLDAFEEDLDRVESGQVKVSMQIREAKWNIIAELVRLAVELAVLALLSFFTGGASATQAALARARSRVFILETLYELSHRTHLLPSLTEAVEEAFTTLAVRLAMMTLAPDGQRPRSIDWKDVGVSGAFGGVAGGLAPVFAKFMKNVTDNLVNPFKKNIDDIVGKFGDTPFKNTGNPGHPGNLRNPGNGRTTGTTGHGGAGLPTPGPRPTPGGDGLGTHSVHQGGQFLADGASESLAESVVMGAFYGNWTPSWQTFVGAGLSERFQAGAEAGIVNTANWLKNPLSLPGGGRPAGGAGTGTGGGGTGGGGDSDADSGYGSDGDAGSVRGYDPVPTKRDGDGDTDSGYGSDEEEDHRDAPLPAPANGGNDGRADPLDTGAGRKFTDASPDAERIRSGADGAAGSRRDPAAPDEVTEPVGRSAQRPAGGEGRVQEPGGDPAVPAPSPHATLGAVPESAPSPAPVVQRDGAQRQWIASQVGAEDLPAGGLPDGPAPDTTVSVRDLTAAGVTLGPAARAQAELGDGRVALSDSGLSTVDQVKALMTRPGPWPAGLDTAAANASLRLWRGSFEDFAGSAPPGVDPGTVRQAWDTASALVLPPEPHSVFADSRYAPDAYRDAVSQVADTLVNGGGRPAAGLADRLRDDLGLPVRGRGDGPGATATTADPRPVPTSSSPSDRRDRTETGHPTDPAPTRDDLAAPGTHAPGTHAPGTHAPGTHAPGTHAPGTHAPGTHTLDPHASDPPVPDTDAPGTHANLDPAPAPRGGPPAPSVPTPVTDPSAPSVATSSRADLLAPTSSLTSSPSPAPAPDTDAFTAPSPQRHPFVPGIDADFTPLSGRPPAGPPSPTGSLGSTAMDLDTPGPEPQAGPHGSPSPDPYRAPLVHAFGERITGDRLYPRLHDAVGRLDTLRALDTHRSLREGPFDLEAVARRVLLLDPTEPVGPGQYGELFRLALEPAMEQAPGLATLAAFGLSLRGALAHPRAMTAPDGTPYGRDWGGDPQESHGLDLDLDHLWEPTGQPEGQPQTANPVPAPWRPGPGRPRPFVVVAGGTPYRVAVLTRDGAQSDVPIDVFIELLAMDPVLSGLPGDVPVLLAVPYAGGRQLDLPRSLADRLGRQVWSSSGEPALEIRDDGTSARIYLEQRPDVPRGDWIRSLPGEVPTHAAPGTAPTVAATPGAPAVSRPPTAGAADVPEWHRNLVSYTMVADGDGTEQTGRAAFHPAEFAGVREKQSRNAHRMTTLAHRHSGAAVATAERPLTVGAKPGERVHHIAAHGGPRHVDMPQEDGTTYRASGEELTGWLNRRPSVRRLRDKDWIYLDACWTGGVYGGDAEAYSNLAASLPPAPDPLADTALAQVVANGTRKRVRAGDRPVGYAGTEAPHPRFWLEAYTDARGRGGRILEFWPEPRDAELAGLARTAGLHTGPGHVPGDTLDVTLRLVRALRQTFGPGIGEDPSHDGLLRGIGALETMRREDPHLNGMGPFTLDLFHRAALANRRDHVDGLRVLDEGAYRALLTRAAGAPAGTRLTDFVRVPQLVGVARQTRNLGDLPTAATRLLRLDPSATVGPAEVSRLYWAQVKAYEWLSSLPDVGAAAAAALHLPSPDPSKRNELGLLATRAIAAGRNPYDSVELAAHHLEEQGALHPQSLMRDAAGRPSGRNWGGPMPPNTHVDASVLGTLTRQPDGSYRRTGGEATPWAGQGEHPAYVVTAEDTGTGRVWITLPGGRRVAVPHAEFAQLLARDPELLARDLWKTDIVLAVSRSGDDTPRPNVPQPNPAQPNPAQPTAPLPASGRPTAPQPNAPGPVAPPSLRNAVVGATGRTVWAPRGVIGLGRSGSTGPVSLAGVPATPGVTAAADWTRTHPSALLPTAPTPPAQAPTAPPQPHSSPAASSSSAASTSRSNPSDTTTVAPRRPRTVGGKVPSPRSRTAPPRVPPAAAALAPIPEDAPAPAPAPTPAPLRLPAVPRPAWVGDDLDARRPPRLDRDLPPAPVTGGGRVTFTDRSRLPAYMGGVGALLPGLPPGVLSRSYRLGQGDRVLRGGEQVAREIGDRLGTHWHLAPAPAAKRRGTPKRTLVDDVRLHLERNPHAFFGDGRQFTYRTRSGRTRVVTVTARPYGQWERFTFGYANPVKVDTMQRTTATTGRTAVNSTSTSLLPSVPLGPAKHPYSVWGRVFFRTSWGKRVQYGQQNQTVNQVETRTTDGSHAHLDDVWYEVAVTDRRGRPVDGLGKPVTRRGTRGVGFGFAVRDGLMVRLADSLTHDAPPAERLPARIDLGGRPAYRSVATETYGPMAHVRAWVLRQAGVKSDTAAGTELSEFFSSDAFQRAGGVLNAGRTTTPPLFRDDAGRSPLGVFSVRVESGEAVLISETKAAELRDITQSTVRNERTVGHSRNTEIGGAVGPSFQWFGLRDGKFNLRLLLGGNFRYGSSRSRGATTGGTGAVKSAAQAKGDPTGLYLVQKTITVTAPPDTKAPLPDRRRGEGRRGKLRKNPPRSWSSPPRSQTFQTWAVERMTRTEARRLAGEDRHLPTGPEPAAPPYLAENDPTTLGMARVEGFSFADGSATRTDRGRERTFPEYVAERVLSEVARVHPDLVAPIDELNPDNPRWRDAAHYEIVLNNTLEVLNTLTHHGMAGSLETMATDGLRLSLVDSGRATRGLRHVWIDARLTGRRYEGKQKDLRLRFSAPGSENLGGQQSAGRGLHGGVEGLLSVRDPATDDIGRPNRAGAASLGGRYGRRSDVESGYGPSATHEAMSISTKGAHLYSYDLTLTARRGGFWRFRSMLRGILFLNLLGTQPFVFRDPRTDLIAPSTTPGSATDTGTNTGTGTDTDAGGPVVGRVLLSIPTEHVPTRLTHRPLSALHGRPLAMTARGARDLALSTRRFFDRAARHRPEDYQRHPFLTLAVTAHPGITDAAQQVLEEASGGSWLLAEEGAPAHDAAMRAFQSQYLTSNFDQTSTPSGWRVSGLWAKAPYLNRSAVVAHRTRLIPGSLTALTGAVSVDTETTLGGVTPAVGRNIRTSTTFFGGQVTLLQSHRTGPGLTGAYGLVVSPYRLDRAQARTVSRVALAEINRKDFNRQVLVTGDVQHEVAAASSTVGRAATGSRYVPRWLAGAAGRRVLVNDGWTGHIPEKSAYRLGLLTDRWGDVPMYTGRSWSPQPWLLDNPFGGFPVNSLNAAPVLRDFDRKLRPLGLPKADRDAIHRLVSARVVRSLGKEMIGSGSSVPASIGRWGSQTAQLWIGERQVRVRSELIPVKVPRTPAGTGTDGEPGFNGLGHSVEFEEHRQAVETELEGGSRTVGASVGTTVSEGVHTGNDVVRAAGPQYSEVGATQQNASQTHSEGGVRIATATTTQAHAEYVTRYRLRLTLEVTDTGEPAAPDGTAPAPATGLAAFRRGFGRWWHKWTGHRRHTIVEEGDVGELVEHLPLSLMRPDPPRTDRTEGTGGADGTGPDPLAPPRLGPAGSPHKVDIPRVMGAGGWHDVVHPGDGTTKPFTLPTDGFKIRRVVGLDHLHTANTLALAAAYDASLDVPRTGTPGEALVAKALDTPLTRAGSGSAQNLEDGTGNGALTSFYDHTLTADGYQIPGLTDSGFFGGADGDLRMYSRPDFRGAQLLTVADGMKHEAPRRDTHGAGMSAARVGSTESSLGGGPLTSSQDTGTNQMGASGPGDSSTESDALAQSGDRLGSVNVKPNTTRSFLFAIPTTWLSVAAVHHHAKDSRAVRVLRGPFGETKRAPQAVETDTTVLAWVREDVARSLGLIDDTGFPPKVGKAWDAVTKADKEWTAADKKYWDLRRDEGPARDAALETAQRDLDTRIAVLDTLPEVVAARDALRALDDEAHTTEPAHEGWAELREEQRQDAVDRLARVKREALAEVTRARDAARVRVDEFDALLRAAREKAEALALEYARVREGADRLTRWHQLHATEQGREQLGTTPEPDEVTFTPPGTETSAPEEPKKKDEGKKEDGRRAEPKKGDGGTGEGADGGAEGPDRGARPAYARPPWQPDPGGSGVRFDAATDHRTLTATGPDGRTRVYDLYRPEADGNGFFAAVAHVVGGRYRDPALLAAAVVRSEEMPKDAPLDPDAVFRTEELDRRIGGTDYGRNPARERLDLAAVEADGGRLPEAVRAVLNPVQRAALVRLHVQRARRWDADTAALAASATARHLGVDLVVVDEDGTEHRHPGRTSRNTGPVPEVTIYRQGDSFLPAVPRTTATSSVTDTARATAPHTGGPSLRPAPSGREPGSPLPSDGTGTGPSLAPPAPPAPTAPPAPPLGAAAERSLAAAPAAPSGGKPVPPVVPGAARGTSAPAAEDARGAPVAAPLVPPTGPETASPPPVRTASVSPAVGPRVTVGGHAFVRRAVAADGDCLLHAVRHGLRTQAPGLPAGRMDVAGLRRYLAHWYTHADAAAELRAAHAAQDPLDLLIRDQFPDRASLLALLGRTRPPELTPAQRERVDERVSDARMRAALLALAAEPGDRELLRDLPTGVARVLLPADPSALPPADRDFEQRQIALAHAETLRAETLHVLRAGPGDPAADALWQRVRAELPYRVREGGLPHDRTEFLALRLDDVVVRALSSADLWQSPFYDEVPLLVARALGVDLVVVRPGARGHEARSLDADATGPTVHVHYNGIDHYESLEPDGTAVPEPPGPVRLGPLPSPAPRSDEPDRAWVADLARGHGAGEEYLAELTGGLSAGTVAALRAHARRRDDALAAPVLPKRVKDEELDADREVRINPLWIPLDDIDPDLLLAGGRDAVWIYTVTPEGRILLGSEKPSDVLPADQFDALLAGVRTRHPETTAEELRRTVDGLGHTGIAARFRSDGRLDPGASRVSGEFLWSEELGSWTVNDKSGRYMSKVVRPDLPPEQAAHWLENVAALFTERLGFTVRPVQVKFAAAPRQSGTRTDGEVADELTLALVPGTKDWLPEALAGALREQAPALLNRPGLGALLSGPDAADALHRWVEFRLAAPDGARRAPQLIDHNWAGGRTAVTTNELKSAGVKLLDDQNAFAVLSGGGVPLTDVTLSPAQRYRLLRLWGDREETLTEVAAAVAAADLGLRVTLTEPGGRARHFDPPPALPEPDPARPEPAAPARSAPAPAEPAPTGDPLEFRQ